MQIDTLRESIVRDVIKTGNWIGEGEQRREMGK